MSTHTAHSPSTAGTAQPEQLSLLRSSELPVQFRLDRRTRERGLEHIAEIRRLLQAKLQPCQTGRTESADRHDRAA